MPASAKTIRARKKLYYAQHREELLLKNRIRYHADPERRREAARRDYALNKERRKALAKMRVKNHPVDPAAKRKAAANYYAKHRDEILLKRRINYHTNLEASRASSREKYRKRRAPSNPKPKEEAIPSYCVKRMDGLVLKLQKIEASKYSEVDCRRQNLEEVVSKITGDLCAAPGSHSMLELHQGEGIFQDSSDLVPTIIQSCQRGCVPYDGLRKSDIVPGVAQRAGRFANEGESVQCHNVWQSHVCETSGELDLAQAEPVHMSDSSGDLSPRVVNQTDSSLLEKSQQKVDEMLTQLESKTATATKQWEEISSAYSKGTNDATVQFISSIYNI